MAKRKLTDAELRKALDDWMRMSAKEQEQAGLSINPWNEDDDEWDGRSRIYYSFRHTGNVGSAHEIDDDEWDGRSRKEWEEEAKKVGIDIYEPEPKKTKRKGVKLM